MTNHILSFLVIFHSIFLLQGFALNTLCINDSLDWYTDAVGETPCMTYQRLRQICNSEYQLPSFRSTVPGDNCDDQVSSCCCNSIAWALSMLCMNCQQDPSASGNGIDAPIGSYGKYLQPSTAVPTNRSLPPSIAAAVCNKGIRIDDTLYNLFWNDGPWFYTYTREAFETDLASNDNQTFTHCDVSSSSSQTPSTPSSQTPSTPSQITSPSPAPSALSSASSDPSSASSAPSETLASSLISLTPSTAPSPPLSRNGTQTAPIVSGASLSLLNSDPSSTATSSELTGPPRSSAHLGAIIGGVVGGVGALIMILLFVVYWRRARADRNKTEPSRPELVPFYTETVNGRPPMRSAVVSQDMYYGASGGDVLRGERKSADEHTFEACSSFRSEVPYSVVPLSSEASSATAWARNMQSREVDGGPAVEFVRSPSGRLPPSYGDLSGAAQQQSSLPGFI